MTQDSGNLRGRLAERARNTPATREPAGEVAQQTTSPARDRVIDLIERQKEQIARALPKHMDADRLARIVITVCRQTPRLLECTPESLLRAVMLTSQLGLEPGPLGHAWFIPFRNNKTGKYEVQWIMGYTGMIDLAYRSGKLLSIEAREVCGNDEFEIEYGLHPKLIHRPATKGDRGKPWYYYGIAHFKDGGHYYLGMSKSDVDLRRARSKASGQGPWVTDYDAMARKTLIRAMRPYLPMSVEFANAAALDGTSSGEYLQPMIEAGRLIPEEVDPPQGVVVDAEPAQLGDAGEPPLGDEPPPLDDPWAPPATDETATAEPDENGEPVTERKTRRMFAQMREKGIVDREQRLRLMARILGLDELPSSKVLVERQVDFIIEEMKVLDLPVIQEWAGQV